MNENAKIINGEKIPVNIPLDKLSCMMESSDMKLFVVACEALLQNGSYEAYELLKKYIASHDMYRRRYVLSVIFNFPFADELIGELEKAIISQNDIIVNTALDVLLNNCIQVSDESIIFALQNGQSYIHSYNYAVINNLLKTEENHKKVLALYIMNHNKSSNKVVIAECLCSFCNSSNFTQLFNLFKNDGNSKIRMIACRLAKKCGFVHLLQQFANDSDGHIRKFIALNC